MLLNLVLSALAASVPHAHDAAPGREIQWTPTLAEALDRAAQERHLVFVALNIDDEGRSRAFREDVYGEKAIVELTRETLNVVASTGEHKRKGPCKLFDGVECIEHQRADADLRERDLVAISPEGAICQPQHLWLDPDGALILSVPFEMTAAEMSWCFAFAAWHLAPAEPSTFPEGAHAPRRVLFGESLRPIAGSAGRGLTDTELDEELKDMKSAFWSEGRIESWRKVVFTDSELAAAHIRSELGTGALTWGGVERLNGAIDVIGTWSPPPFAPLLTDFVKHRDPTVRRHVAVALEQMGDSETLDAVRGALSREKDPGVKKAWLRALGACGHSDKRALRTLLGAARSEKEPELRRNAIVALGWAGGEDDVVEALAATLASEDENEVVAALCATAFSRAPRWIPIVEGIVADAPEGSIRQAGDGALRVLRGAGLAAVEEHVRRVCRDELPRDRIFFRAR